MRCGAVLLPRHHFLAHAFRVFSRAKCVLTCRGVRNRVADAVPARDMNRDFCDLKFFRSLVRALSSAGIQVAIASFGVYGVIQVR